MQSSTAIVSDERTSCSIISNIKSSKFKRTVLGVPPDTCSLSLPLLWHWAPPWLRLTYHFSSYLTVQGLPLAALQGVVLLSIFKMVLQPLPILLQIPHRLDGWTGQPVVNFAPENSPLGNERHLRLLDYLIGVPYLWSQSSRKGGT